MTCIYCAWYEWILLWIVMSLIDWSRLVFIPSRIGISLTIFDADYFCGTFFSQWKCYITSKYQETQRVVPFYQHDDVIKWKHFFRVTGPLCGEFTGHRWIPLTKASDAEFWCFLWSAPWTNGGVNNRDADDLRRHRAHYDVIVMSKVLATEMMHRFVANWNVGPDRSDCQ